MEPHIPNGRILVQTQRLTLREFTPEDLDALHALNSNPLVMQFIGPMESMAASQATLQRIFKRYVDTPGQSAWVTQRTVDGAFCGFHLLKQLETSPHIEVGYRLLPRFWNHGFATEGAHALLRHGFETLGLKTIVGITHPDNRASQRVLMKLGMELRRMDHFYGVDVTFFDVDVEHWRARQEAVTPA